MPLSFVEFLAKSDFYEIILDTIERDDDNQNEFLFKKLSESDEDKAELIRVQPRCKIYKKQQQYSMLKSLDQQTVADLFVNLILAINKKFLMPEDNSLAHYLVSTQEKINNHKFLSETILNLFNAERKYT